ncbi:MAG TPA: hypothetical protein VHB54_01685 [Mucilaginibacter sp.]|nr:hypothetical protein [Mucilaginibacter sp.]
MKLPILKRLYRFYDQEGRSLYKLLLIDPVNDIDHVLWTKTVELGMQYGRPVFYEEIGTKRRND